MTDHDYHSALARLATADPANLLLNKLRQGPGTVNKLLLAQQLRKLGEQPVTERAAVEQEWEEEEADALDDETLRGLRVRLRKLFSDRARLSDRFWTLKNTQERAYNSEDVQVVQRNIERTMQAVRHWKIHGTLPDELQKHYVPKDGLELARRQNSLRANVSRQRRIVRELQEAELNDMATARKLEKALDRLQELKTDLSNVTEAIKNLRK